MPFFILIGHLIFWHIYKNRVYTYGKKRLILPFYDCHSTFFFSKISKTIDLSDATIQINKIIVYAERISLFEKRNNSKYYETYLLTNNMLT